MLRRALYALGFAAVGTCAVLVAASPIFRSLSGSRAHALGLTLSIDKARLGWGVARLSGVTVTSPELPGVEISFSDVVVAPSFGSSPRRIDVHGGKVHLNGTLENLERDVRAWRAAHGNPNRDDPSSGSVTPISADGIDVVWSGASAAVAPEFFWGVRYARQVDGRESIGVDLARFAAASASVEVSRGLATLEHDGALRTFQGLSVASLHATIDLDSDGTPNVRPLRGTTGKNSPQPNKPAFPAEDTAAQDRGPKLRADFAKTAEKVALWLKPATKVEVSGVHIEVRNGGQVLNIGPATVNVSRDQSRARIAITSGASDGAAPIRFDVDVPFAEGAVAIGLAGGPVSLRALGVKENDMGLEDVERAEMEVNGRATLSDDGRSLRISGSSRLDALSMYQPRLASEPVRGLALALAGQTDVSLDGSRVHVDDLQIGVGKVKLHATGDLTREEGHAKGQLHVEIPLAACSDMLASIPPSLVPLLSGMEVTGTFAFSGDLSFDTRRPGDTRVDWNAANECRITKVPATIAPERFSHPWERTVLGAGGIPTTIESGPGTRDWVSLADITPFMATAVVVCEDASFWVHGGFNEKSIRDSIRDNLRAGKFLRGASTVSMQLAKNLYLAREKTLSRKLQEAVLTLLLEQSLTKEQILELYLNVIEFAPGTYGIGPAAEHYFKSDPRDLSLGQAFYLVSILPNPKVHHFATDGSLSPMWTEYLRHLMGIAHKIHKIDDHELSAGLTETIHFGVPSATDGQPTGTPGSTTPDVDLGPPDAEPPEDGP